MNEVDLQKINFEHKNTRLVRWEGDVPPEYIGKDVDPENPPPGVLQIININEHDQVDVLYEREGIS